MDRNETDQGGSNEFAGLSGATKPKELIDDEIISEAPDLSFDELDIPDRVMTAISTLGWQQPTRIQSLCLPYTLQSKDLAGFAQTGTGKTGVFLITAGCRIKPGAGGPQAIVLAPTRELAVQINDDAKQFLSPVGIRSLAVFGGIDYAKQASELSRGVELVVATPGRLKDYLQKKVIGLEQCELFVCDEADRMFDMGFIDDVEFFLERIPEKSQKLLFSATTNEQVKELAFEYLENPRYIAANPEVVTPEAIEQHAIHCNAVNKLKVMIGLIQEHRPACAIVFTNTKLTAEWLHFKLEKNGIDVDMITGDLPQKKRIRLIKRIKEGKVKALIATDVASRGLHIAGVTHVYNFDLPDEPANYVHRIGRTARAGAKGSSYSLVCDDYGQNLVGINELLGEASLSTEWFNEEYLKIEDKAGNPFAEGLGGSRHDGQDRQNARRDRPDRKREPDRNRKGASRSGRNDRGPKRKSPGRSGSDGSQPQRGSQKRQRPRRGRKDRAPRLTNEVAQSVEQPKTISGIIRRFVSTFLKRKNRCIHRGSH